MSRTPVKNEHLAALEVDFLYHLGLDSSADLAAQFGDVRFVCMGGSATRALKFAGLLKDALGVEDDSVLEPIGKTERYSLYKVGPVISVNHGMGMPSHSILLHEITKLLHYANAKDVIYMRIGTSGGLGVPRGTVVAATSAMGMELRPVHRAVVLGEVREYPASLDKGLSDEVVELAKEEPSIPCAQGYTMGTDDFYEGQGRLDGAICEYGNPEREAWLRKLADAGVRNMEMEAPQFAAFCNRVGVRAVLLNGVLLNRLEGDQVTSTPEQLAAVSHNAQTLALRLIKKHLSS